MGGMPGMMAQPPAAAAKKAAKGQAVNSAGDGANFNADAPVFVPGRGMVLEGATGGAAAAKGDAAADGLDEAAADDEDEEEEAGEADVGDAEEEQAHVAVAGPPPG